MPLFPISIVRSSPSYRVTSTGGHQEYLRFSDVASFVLTKISTPVSHAKMQGSLEFHLARFSRPRPCRVAMALALSLNLCATGCLSPLARHSMNLVAATAPVLDQAAAAYRSANTIHDRRMDYDAVAEFDAAAPVYNPRTIEPLMSDRDIEVRLVVLAAFQAYVRSVVAITSGTESPRLQAAAKSAGEDLRSLGGALAPSINSIFGIAATSVSGAPGTVGTTSASATTVSSTPSTAAKAVNPITPAIQNGMSTAVNALAQFLISRKIKKELPHTIQAMDAHVTILCDLLQSDIAILKEQEGRDYDFIINRQTLFVRASNLDPDQRREGIMKLPEMVREERVSEQQLSQLGAAVARLELTHHAYAAEAQGNSPNSLKDKLEDLGAAGSDLGKFYASLSTK